MYLILNSWFTSIIHKKVTFNFRWISIKKYSISSNEMLLKDNSEIKTLQTKLKDDEIIIRDVQHLRSFKEFGIASHIYTKLPKHIENPSHIQAKVIPLLLSHRNNDIVIQSVTGSGKTFAFLLPILSKINNYDNKIQAILTFPTRELMIQVSKIVKILVYGGKKNYKKNPIKYTILTNTTNERLYKQISDNNYHLILSTFSGFINLYERTDVIKLVNYLVIDEADMMLKSIYFKKFKEILASYKSNKKKKRIILCSASLYGNSMDILVNKYLSNPIRIMNDHILRYQESFYNELPSTIKHYSVIYKINYMDKAKIISKIYSVIKPKGFVLVFVNDMNEIPALKLDLIEKKYNVLEIHNKISRTKKSLIHRYGKNLPHHFNYIILSTEMSSRGIDFQRLSLVINLDMPIDTSSYLHRAGRVGRLGGDYYFDKNKFGKASNYIHSNGMVINVLDKDTRQFNSLVNFSKNLKFKMNWICFDNIGFKSIDISDVKEFIDT